MFLKHYFFILLLSSFFSITENTFAQKLSFNDLAYCLSHRIDEIDTYLGNKGYEFFKYTEKEVDYGCPTTTWAYSREISDNRADAFIARYCENINEGFVWYQPKDKRALEDIKSECLKKGFKFISKKFETSIGAIIFMYKNNNYKIEFTSGLNKYNSNVYSVTLHNL